MISKCEFVSGWISGVLGTVTGHPMDTVKVRLQTSSDKSILNNIRTMYFGEGFRSFYKGLAFPVVSMGVLNSVFFGVYGNCLRSLVKGQEKTLCCEEEILETKRFESENKFWHVKVAFAGMLGGFASVLIGCPVDCVKTKLQGNSKKIGPWRVIKHIYHIKGWRGLYCGFLPMLCRDGPGFATYIVAYEHIICSIEGELKLGQSHRLWAEIVSGGTAGCASWMISMPFDVIKSRIQVDDPTNPKYKGMGDCIRKSYKNEGPSVFIRGIGISFWRSFPVNAVNFVSYQFSMRKCNDFQNKL